jgi:tetratricopeptide (TPR) repeat protein
LAVRSLGLVHRAVGELDQALELSLQALAILRSVADEKHEAYGLQSVAKVLIRMGRGDEAQAMLDQAQEICDRLADYWGVAFMLRTRGELNLDAGRWTQAEADLTAAIKLWEERDVALMPARARRDLANVLDALGDRDGAVAMRRAALATFRTYGAREYGELVAGDAAPTAGL